MEITAVTPPEELLLTDPDAAELVHGQMAELMGKIGYTNLCSVRPFDEADDPLGILKLDRPHLPGKEFDSTVFEHIGALLEALVIHKEDLENAIIIMEQLLKEWLPHLDNGGNLALLTNHMSYVDVLVVQYCLAAAELRLRGIVSTDKHHAIVGRAVGLMEMNGLKPDGSAGYIVEDTLLPLGSVFQTIPPDQGDEELPESLRNQIGKVFLDSYETTLSQGGNIIVLAGSGVEDDINEGHILMHRIKTSTTALLRKPNRTRTIRHDGSNKEIKGSGITMLTVFLDLQPIKDGMLQGPVHASIGVGRPVVAQKQGDIHKAIDEFVILGNETKLSTTPEIIYETEEESTERRIRSVAATAIRNK